MTSPTLSSLTGTTSARTSDPRSYVPVIDPETIAYRSQPKSAGASTASASSAASTSAAPDMRRPARGITRAAIASRRLCGVEVELHRGAVALVGVARGAVELDGEPVAALLARGVGPQRGGAHLRE